MHKSGHRIQTRFGPTLADIAADVGLSSSTVSRALDPRRSLMVNSKTRELISEAAERLGYLPHFPARSLMTGRTQTIVVIAADLGNPWVTPILHGVASRVVVDGIVPIIAETNNDSQVLAELINHMLARGVDAIVILAAQRQDAEVIEYAGRIVPTVVAARTLLGVSVPIVTHDDRRGGEMVAEHFADLGHKLVAQLLGPSDVRNFLLRSEGFAAVLNQRHLRQLSIGDEAIQPTLEEGFRLMTKLFDSASETPTAVFAHNDAMAIGAMAAIREHGLSIPEDISVSGYNDMPLTEFLAPSLTTVHYPGWEVGDSAGEVALRLLAGEHGVESVSLDPIFIPRGSSKQLT